MKNHHYYDVLVIGSGASGLSLALSLSEYAKVAILSKGAIDEGCTNLAQGGIAAAIGRDDSVESHIEDILRVGDGLCDEETVRFVSSSAKKAIDWLVKQGLEFSTTEDGDFHLAREGGHSRRRVLHSADATGKAIETNLIRQIEKTSAKVFSEYTAIDLIKHNERCIGVHVLNNKLDQVETFQAKFVVIATGGASKAYVYTTNPDCASGDGIAMAWRAGCKIADMEFNQFHPTCLYHAQAKSFLISEAVRGEGGRLLLPSGERFMSKFDERADLAPRDIVARAIDFEMKRLGIKHVYLDITHKSPEFIVGHFPNIYMRCLEYGIDITKDRIPVVPAAHYTCGGIVVDQNGYTNLSGLYAIGEASCTGLHGANRIASSSLLECVVYAMAASEDIKKRLTQVEFSESKVSWGKNLSVITDEKVMIDHSWEGIRRIMWNYVGIVRTNYRLEKARIRIEILKSEIQEYYNNFKISRDLIELRNLVIIADLMVNAAIKRKDNVGLHYNLDNVVKKKNR